MWWRLNIAQAIWFGKKNAESCHEETLPPLPPTFEERGDLDGPKVVVIGRTGAGKSSLLNMMVDRNTLAVGPVAYTTRWIEGVRSEVAGRPVIFVDTPGYGEAHTHGDYSSRLVNSIKKYATSVEMVLLVLQADAKAYSDDKQILSEVRGVVGGVPVAIILNQVDEIPPSREPFKENTWPGEKKKDTLKSQHVAEKVAEVCRQFKFEPESVEPSVSVDDACSRSRILKLIAQRLDQAPV